MLSDLGKRINPTIAQRDEWMEARFRARLLTPSVITAVAPLILAAILATLLGPQITDFLRFRDFVFISLFFVPAIAIVTAWQARILTAGPPLREQALTGLSALLGVLLNLLALAVTLSIASVGALIFVYENFGLTPELLMDWIIRIGLVAAVIFLVLSPYFMVVGAVLGLITAAVVHHSYRPGWLPQATRPLFAALTLVPLALIIATYIVVCRPPRASESCPPLLRMYNWSMSLTRRDR